MGDMAGDERVQAAARTRVLLVDDHRMFAELLRESLRAHDDVEIVGLARDGAEAIAVAEAEHPDVVVIDYRLPGDDGVIVASQLRRVVPDAALLMLTGHDEDGIARSALAAGCTGFLTKDRASTELIDAVRAIRDGGVAIEPHRMTRLATEPSARGAVDTLTAREREVLRLLAEGSSTREIAEQLFISHNTARNHVQRMIRKLGAHSRLEAVAIAHRRGLVDRPHA